MKKKKRITSLNKEDREFFQRLYDENKQLLYHTASSYTSTADERDDLVQETVVRLMNNVACLRNLSCCKIAYYIVITIRTAYIDIRRARGDHEIISLDEDMIDSLCDSNLEDRKEPDMSSRIAVQKLKESLPERDWYVLVGKYIMGYTHDELGALLGIKAANVRMILSRAKTKARELLQNEQGMGADCYD